MSSSSIVNAAPMTLLLGIQDLSTRALAVQPEQIPTHLPKVYLYAKKGPTTPQLVVGDGLVQMYGDTTFDEQSTFATHQTVLSNIVNSKGNAQMIERMLPSDAGPKANFLLSIDVLATTVPTYQRGADGTYITDGVTGLPLPTVPAGTVPGFVCKWVVTSVTTGGPAVADSTSFGVATSAPGDQSSGSSTRYPIMQFWATSYGAYGNNSGFRIYAPTANSETPVNSNLLNAIKCYPFRMSAISRVNSTSTPTIQQMMTGDQYFDFVLKTSQVNPATTARVSLGDVFPTAYQSVGNPGYQDLYADIGNIKLYQSNIDTVLGLFYAAEKSFTGAGSDFTALATDEMYKFNFFTGVSSTGAPYHSFAISNADANATALTINTNLFAAGGSDGTMNETLFAGLVTTAVTQYNNPLSPLQDTATNVESIIYDTGFPLATKRALTNFIAIRKDTFVVLSTYDVNGSDMVEADEAALGIALRTQLQLFPESSYFGTPVVRGLVMGRYGKMLGRTYPKKLPLTLELASKSAAFMGAGNRVWNPVYLFDRAPGSEVTLFDANSVNVTFTPAQQRNVDWSNGLNYPIRFSRSSLFFPAMKTAYSDDTSVLTNFLTAMACVQLEKVGEQVWREFSGAIDLTDAQLLSKVNQSVIDKTTGVFAGLYKIVPKAFISGGDAKRGYSYSLPINIYANNSKTVMTLSIVARRMSDYVAK